MNNKRKISAIQNSQSHPRPDVAEMEESHVCCICNKKLPVSSRGCCNIFTSVMSVSKCTVSDKLGDVLGVSEPLVKGVTVSMWMCKLCLKLLRDVDSIEGSLKLMKNDLRDQYHKTYTAHMKTKTTDPVIPTENVTESDNVETQAPRFSCTVCSMEFDFSQIASLHARSAHSTDSHYCEICSKHFSRRSERVLHEQTHAKQTFQCRACLKVFNESRKYNIHVKGHIKKSESPNETNSPESKEVAHACSECGKACISAAHLEAHERTHRDNPSFDCHTCGRVCGNAAGLQSHLLVHTGEKPHVCQVCGKAFARKQKLQEHGRVHTGEKPFQCEECGATFRQQSNLHNHKRNIHLNLKPYPCPICGVCFKRKRLVTFHVKSRHTGEKSFHCKICSASFVYPHHYKKHVQIHSGEKPHKCEICNKAFNNKDNRNMHRFIHSDKKPYECKSCGQGFMRKAALYAHMESEKHQEEIIVVNQLQLHTDQDNSAAEANEAAATVLSDLQADQTSVVSEFQLGRDDVQLIFCQKDDVENIEVVYISGEDNK